MAIPWLLFGLELLVVFPFHIMIDGFPAAIVVIIINALAVEHFLLKQSRNLSIVLTLAFSFRMLAAVFDSKTLILSTMNPDCLGYFSAAKDLANGQLTTNGGMYSRLLSIVFKLTGSSRILTEYINVLLGLTTIWILYKSLMLIITDKRKIIFANWIIAVFPYSIYGSCVTYRESVIATFVALSAYFALKWYIKPIWNNLFACMACLAFASTFHAGVIMLAIGYAVLFILYSKKYDKMILNRHSFFILLVFIIFIIVIIVAFPDIFLGKFNGMTEESIIAQVNRRTNRVGGSVYLTWLRSSSLIGVIFASPLKLLYFLFSPLPGDWRGIVDIVTFLIDGCVYLYCIYYTLKNYKESKYRHFIAAIFIGWIITALVFGLGTWTAGTAIRHRNKIFMVLLLITVMSSVRNDKERAQDKI